MYLCQQKSKVTLVAHPWRARATDTTLAGYHSTQQSAVEVLDDGIRGAAVGGCVHVGPRAPGHVGDRGRNATGMPVDGGVWAALVHS
jgi:hypothetical protein